MLRRSAWLALGLTAVACFAVAQEAKPLDESAAIEVTTQPTTYPAAPADARITEEGWFAPAKRGTPLPPLPEEVTKAFVIPIREEIKTKTFKALQRKVVRCRAAGAELIVLDMDTWGGQVIAALDISRLLKAELGDIRTVCYVNTRGISAGALIATSCDQIVMTPVGTLGDCAPILMGGKLEGVEREKMETVLRKDFAESAQRSGYPVALAECMVSIHREAWLVRHLQTRELRYVSADEFRGKVAVPPGVSSAPSKPDADWELLRVIVPNDELLTVTAAEAEQYGFATALIEAPREDSLAGVMEHFNVTVPPTILADNWSERLVEFLTSAPVAGFLLFLAILCGYVEMHTPGFGVAGSVAIVAIALLFGSSYLVGLAAWWEIALFGLGVVLLGVEIFITPGFGVLGISGILCCIVALLAMVVPNAPDKLPIPDTALAWDMFTDGVLALMLAFIGACIAGALLAKVLPKAPLANRLLLEAPIVAPANPTSELAPIQKVRVGDLAHTHGPCRPVGQIRIGDELLDAVTEGQFIAAGMKVKIVEIEGNRVVITPVA